MADPMPPVLEVSGLKKSFPGVLALGGVSLKLNKGEVLALIGENGAGKSTLMKILAGVQPADEGKFCVDGKDTVFRNVNDAMDQGIALIHQELNLCGNLDLASNIFLGREPKKFGFIDQDRMTEQAKEYLAQVGLDLPVDTLAGSLPIGKQQLVEIAKALSSDARVLIMDEPTSSLSQKETETLFDVVTNLRDRGISVIYISHRLGEVIRLADRVTVFRDGENAGDLSKDEINHNNMVSLMVGRELSEFFDRSIHNPGEKVLSLKNFCSPTFPNNPISLDIHAGEIVGIAGLVGAGRTELLQTIFGVTPAVGGTLEVGETESKISNPKEAISSGIALVPEDRKQHGLVLPMTVRENSSLPSLQRDSSRGWINQTSEQNGTQEAINSLKIKTPSPEQVAQFLSGGNQQKIVLGKWLAMNPKLLMLDEPTRGIDIGAKREIYKLMENLAAKEWQFFLFLVRWKKFWVWPIVPMLCTRARYPVSFRGINYLKNLL